MLVAELTGTARHHARWRSLTEDEETAAVTELRELADGRADLLAQVAGIFEAQTKASSTSRSPAAPRTSAVRPGLILRRSRRGSRRDGCAGPAPTCHRFPAVCTLEAVR
jgi:hypothetical protein